MHTYLRIIQNHGPESYSNEEQQKLRDCLSSAPGIETIKELKRHMRGGYSVTMKRKDDALDALISHITFHGYRAVV